MEVRQIEIVVEGTAHLFSEAARYLVSEEDFDATLMVLGFSPELNQQLKQVCTLDG